jgi:hypothetical protein
LPRSLACGPLVCPPRCAHYSVPRPVSAGEGWRKAHFALAGQSVPTCRPEPGHRRHIGWKRSNVGNVGGPGFREFRLPRPDGPVRQLRWCRNGGGTCPQPTGHVRVPVVCPRGPDGARICATLAGWSGGAGTPNHWSRRSLCADALQLATRCPATARVRLADRGPLSGLAIASRDATRTAHFPNDGMPATSHSLSMNVITLAFWM